MKKLAITLALLLIATQVWADQYTKVDNATVTVVKQSAPAPMTVQQAQDTIANLKSKIAHTQDMAQQAIQNYQNQIADIELGFQSTLGIDVTVNAENP